MRRRLFVFGLCALSVWGAWADESEERGAWRVSVGASVIGGVKSRVGVNAGRVVNFSRFGQNISRLPGFAPGRSKEDADKSGSGVANGGRRVFDNGAWYDPVDSGSGNDAGWSWNWRLNDPSGPDPEGKKGFVEQTAYVDAAEVTSVTAADVGGASGESTEWLPGLRVELSHELYASEGERRWGVDLAVAFAYYFQRDVWKASGTAATASAVGSRKDGYYEWWNNSHDEAQYILDYYRDTQFDGSMWGAGSFGGPGAELASDAWKVRDIVTRTDIWSDSYKLAYQGSGSYREYSIECLARPWWEPWSWLRLFASLGVEISRREFEWSLSARGTDGTAAYESGRAADWRVCGLLGGGLGLQWKSFVLAGEALWRFGGDDLDVSGETVNGKITHGDWGFRLSLGYEF